MKQEYDVIVRLDISDLIERINQKTFDDGWQCVGGIAIETIEDDGEIMTFYRQAIVRDKMSILREEGNPSNKYFDYLDSLFEINLHTSEFNRLLCHKYDIPPSQAEAIYQGWLRIEKGK